MLKNLPIILVGSFLFLTFSSHAQNILLEELFNDSSLGQFDEYSEIGDGELWEARDFNDKFFAQMNGFNDGVQDNVDWLISPVLNMDQYDDEILSFENASNFDGPDLELLFSTDYDGGGDPTTATWNDISSSATWSPGGYEYVNSGDIDLSAVTGDAYIAFRYTSSDALQGKLYQIDSIVVQATMLTNTESTELLDKISAPYVLNGQLVFTILDSSTELKFSINSIDGKVVSDHNDLRDQGKVSISVDALPNGPYILVASSKGSIKSYKFIK